MFPSHCFPESSQPVYISGSNLHSAESLPHSYASSPNAVAIVTLCKLWSHEIVPEGRESHVYLFVLTLTLRSWC
jgi:hypothetical protein